MRPICPGIKEVEHLKPAVGSSSENGDRSAGTLSKHPDAAHVEVAARVQVIENHLDVVDSSRQRFWKLAHEPVLGRQVLGSLSSKGRHKANGCGAAASYALAIAVVLEAIGIIWE